jgi:hypothetical protein
MPAIPCDADDVPLIPADGVGPAGDGRMGYHARYRLLGGPGDGYLLVGDEVVVAKAGKTTHGLDCFFASLYGKPVPGLAFFVLSLVSTQEWRSFPVHVEQVVRNAAEKAATRAKELPSRRDRPLQSAG